MSFGNLCSMLVEDLNGSCTVQHYSSVVLFRDRFILLRFVVKHTGIIKNRWYRVLAISKGVPINFWCPPQKELASPRSVHLIICYQYISVLSARYLVSPSALCAIQALSAAAAALSFVTRAAGDAIHADVAAAETRTAAVVRVQALARGVVTRRTLRAANAAASVVQAWARARAARHERACSFTTAPVRVQPATPVALQALWRGVMSREALFRKTIAAVTLQR